MKVREVLQILHDDGWFVVATRGSHRQLKHSSKSGALPLQENPVTTLRPVH
jgi:predicted RNA binding protein YcfA (HicA-like mRNA interferase family)